MMGGGGVDVVINYIGGDIWVKFFWCLIRGGRFLICGVIVGFNLLEDICYIWIYEFNVMGFNGWMLDD